MNKDFYVVGVHEDVEIQLNPDKNFKQTPLVYINLKRFGAPLFYLARTCKRLTSLFVSANHLEV